MTHTYYPHEERLEDKPISLEDAITILADGRPIRRSLRRACIETIRKAVNKLQAYENMYSDVEELEKQVARYLIQSFEIDTNHIISILKERYNLNE